MIFAACTIAAFGSSMMPSDALAQKQSLKEQLVGTWMLLSWEQKKDDGTKVERYGTSPKGMAFFDADGRYFITVMRSDRAKYASNALWQGTPEENKETADGTITYFGSYAPAEAESSIAIHVEGSSFPNWNGTDQKRFVAMAGDQLTLTVRPPGGDVVDVIWKRAKLTEWFVRLGHMQNHRPNVSSRHQRGLDNLWADGLRPPHQAERGRQPQAAFPCERDSL
ncbi:lipocalin-like domain-containing protein [Bradyrhizobium sp. RDM12]